jgi:septum formation protein
LDIVPADIDESIIAGEDPEAYTARLALEKASTVAADHPGRWVIAADTTVAVGDDILGKAESDAQATQMLLRLVGGSHRVITAFTIYGPNVEPRSELVTTRVTMRDADPEEVERYVASGEWVGKAGAYAVQGIAAALVSAVYGSITNVIGLPLSEIVSILAELGAPAADYENGDPA